MTQTNIDVLSRVIIQEVIGKCWESLYAVTVIRDLTLINKIENLLNRIQKQLKSSEIILQLFLNHIFCAITIFVDKKKITSPLRIFCEKNYVLCIFLVIITCFIFNHIFYTAFPVCLRYLLPVTFYSFVYFCIIILYSFWIL